MIDPESVHGITKLDGIGTKGYVGHAFVSHAVNILSKNNLCDEILLCYTPYIGMNMHDNKACSRFVCKYVQILAIGSVLG